MKEKPVNNVPAPGRRLDAGPRKRRRATRMLVAILAFVLIAPLVPYAWAYVGASNNPNPGADLWREVRQREAPSVGRTQSPGVDSAVLINKGGEDWRHFRMEQLVPISAWLLGGLLAAITLFYFLRGRVMIEGGRSGMVVERFSVAQRIVHWCIAGLFLLLAVTGLVLLYGRFVLIPVLGPEGFAATASASKEAHNLFGPLFPFAVLAVFIYYVKGNRPRWRDVQWFANFGGLLKKGGHAASGRYNGGQKSWFWMIVIFGLIISVSGYVLVFPNFGQGREIMALAHLGHGIIAILFIAAALGHIYIGSVGMEGALDAMTKGEVDTNWAREHHDIWLQQMEAAGQVRPASGAGSAGDQAPDEATVNS